MCMGIPDRNFLLLPVCPPSFVRPFMNNQPGARHSENFFKRREIGLVKFKGGKNQTSLIFSLATLSGAKVHQFIRQCRNEETKC